MTEGMLREKQRKVGEVMCNLGKMGAGSCMTWCVDRRRDIIEALPELCKCGKEWDRSNQNPREVLRVQVWEWGEVLLEENQSRGNLFKGHGSLRRSG